VRGDAIGIGRGDGDGDCIRTLANANKVYADAVPAEEKRASRQPKTSDASKRKRKASRAVVVIINQLCFGGGGTRFQSSLSQKK
jgi:hypothetical protein